MSELLKLAGARGKSRLESAKAKQPTTPRVEQKTEVPQPSADDLYHCADPKLPADY